MEKLCVFLVLAILANQALGMNLRQKRQSDYDEDDSEDSGWNWSAQRPLFPGQGQSSWQNQLPGQGPSSWQNQLPGQGQSSWQNQLPDQGQSSWQNQLPGQGQSSWQNQLPDQGQMFGQLPATTPAPIGTTTLSATVQTCIRNCPVTPEYNPVCGSDTQTYNNPGRLVCAQTCGVRVTQVRSSPCPTATAAPTN